MSHNGRHEVIPGGFCDWMEGDVKKGKGMYFFTMGEGKVRLSFSLRAGGGGGEFVFMWWAHEKTSL